MRSLRYFFKGRQNVFALSIVFLFVILGMAAPWLAPQEPGAEVSAYRIDPRAGKTLARRLTPLPPDDGLIFGTAPGGFDIFYSLIWGIFPALRFGLVIAVSTAVVGSLLGALGGYIGGWFNRLVMRITDSFLAFPALAGLFLFQQLLIPVSLDTPPTLLQETMQAWDIPPVMLVLIFASWMPYARIINANIVRLKHEEYIMAARTVGAGNRRIVFRHLLPNSIAPLIVLAARDVGVMVILEASFTFIGVGGYLPWSVLLVSSRDFVIGLGGNPFVSWWVFVPATIVLALFSISWNLLGDGLNDALNPRLTR